jgi:hypothetical protein
MELPNIKRRMRTRGTNQPMSDRMKPIAEGIGPLFAALERRAKATLDLADKVRAALPADTKDHVISASYRDDTLVVLVDSAAWATHIRYAQKELLERLRAAGETQFTKLKVKVGRGAPGAQGSA